ncbi:hypothetical protein VRC18_24590 [Pseudomonas trivialis]|uniref:hypothetical protein n=1 Tax=Pseudomonas trivialis TaxID=200450 RepID=UPI0030D5D448
MTAIDIIKEFVEGSISPKEFEEKVYADATIEALLKGEKNLPAYVSEPDLYTYAISLDFRNLECIYNIQSLLSGVLSKNGITHTVEKKYENLFNLTLKIQPKWLMLPSEYLSNLIEEKKI